MKKVLLIFFSFIIACSVLFLPASAADITITPGTEQFIFNPTDKDMFEDFKDMMPGDSRTQQIALSNKEQNINATVYMRAEVEQKDKDFLRWYKISIYISKDKNSKGTLIADNIASVEGSLTEDVKLATVGPNETYYITVEIQSDIQMSNDYKLESGIIHWIFSCEEEVIQEETTTKEQPTTKQDVPTTQENTTRERTTRSTTHYTTKPRSTTEVPSTSGSTYQPQDQEKLPYTGGEINIIPIVSGLLALAIIVIMKTKKEGEQADEA